MSDGIFDVIMRLIHNLVFGSNEMYSDIIIGQIFWNVFFSPQNKTTQVPQFCRKLHPLCLKELADKKVFH